MGYYPVNLNLENVACLVIGGGQVGERKIMTLLSCGAKVYLISRELTSILKEAVEQGRVIWLAQGYEDQFLEGKLLVIGATDDEELNARISREARERGVLCNIVDNPPLCDFILPSIVRRGDLSIAISTGGKSPALAKKIRRKLDREFPESYGPYVQLLGLVRSQLLPRGMTQQENQKIFEALIDSPLLTWLENGEAEAFYDLMNRLIHPPLPWSELSPTIDRLFYPLK
jgi:precorrin-2 dehydrogenase / sirohydrochlorin ferrochelatase